MKIEFYGAAGCVTGSCHIIYYRDKVILLDCGMFQGKDEKERGNNTFIFDPVKIDCVILSHAHIDHSGRIPLLYKYGYRGRVICNEITKDLCNVMLPDSGHIQEMEVEWKNRKRIRRGLDLLEPMYDANIARECISLFEGHAFDEWIKITEGLKICFREAGHLLGAAITEIVYEESGIEKKIVYTGDLGNTNIPLIGDPSIIKKANYVIMETTYGDRVHDSVNAQFNEFIKIIKDTFSKGGNVIIPSFAVGRTQEVIYALNGLVEKDELKGLTVYVDSPLASESTKVFEKYPRYYDEEARSLIDKDDDPLNFTGLIFTKSSEESKNLNKIKSGAVIISASGMCDAGRIKHHLKHNLWRTECAIVFVGYQAEGTIGRAILDGTKKVKLFGEEIAVNAKIYSLQGLSGHADMNGLANWLDGFEEKPQEVLLVHGDSDARSNFKNVITLKGYKAEIMNAGEIYSFDMSEVLKTTKNKEEVKVKVSRKDRIIKLLDSVKDLEDIKEEVLLEKIEGCLREK